MPITQNEKDGHVCIKWIDIIELYNQIIKTKQTKTEKRIW